MAKLEIHDKIINFEIIRRQRKTLEIQIDSISGFRVIAPKRVSEKAILAILEPRKEWIYQKMIELEESRALQPKRTYTDGETFFVLGHAYQLNVLLNEKCKKAKAKLNNGQIQVETADLSRTCVRAAVIAFYREYTKNEIENRIGAYVKKLNVTYNRIVIKDQKRRWGSCSHLGNLNFNWRCGIMPEFVLEYILAHEVCHLVHLNHSKDYWNLLHSVCPYEAEARLWLKKQGSTLDI